MDIESILDLLSRPEDQPFVLKILTKRLEDDERLAYADALASCEPLRAEWLRLEVELHREVSPTPAQRARFVELQGQLSRDFVNLFRRDITLNCGQKRDEPRRVRFRFSCDQRWETLEPTEHGDIRFCSRCSERVYHCERAKEAQAHALAGHCISVPKDLADGSVSLDVRHYLGMPDPIGDWMAQFMPEDP